MCFKLVITRSYPMEHTNPKSRSKKALLIKQLINAKELNVVPVGPGAVRLVGEMPVYLKFDPRTGKWATTIDGSVLNLGQGFLTHGC